MSHDATHATAALIASSAAITFASAPQVPLTDFQVLMISASCGAIGGVVATLMSDQVITMRGMAMRGMASVLIAPGIVSALLLHYNAEPRLLTVASAAGIAGIIAWPIAQRAQQIVNMAINKWLSAKVVAK